MIHKHWARALHYDFRLEIGDTMPSWSVPKGPSLDPKVRRLAMPTGPHELEYRKFEGVIEGGSYGAGAVMIWDTGTYNPEVELEGGGRREVRRKSEAQKTASAGLNEGNLKFRLYGKKLGGSFALVKTKGWGNKEAWLLIKHKDGFAKVDFDLTSLERSVVSGRTIEEILLANQEKLG